MTTTTPLRPEEDAEQSARPRRRRTVAIVLAAVAAVAAFVVWLVAFSSAFGVRSIEVDGVHSLSAAQVRSAAGVASGTPLVRVDTAAVARRIKKLSDVAGVEVHTSFPSTLVIAVTERQPVGYVRTSGLIMLVDRTGDQYHQVATAPNNLPRFVVPAGTDARTTGGAVATVAAALPASLRHEVRSIQALDPQAITLVLTHGRVVHWGSAARSADKARVLPVLLDHGGGAVDVVDVSDPDQPFTR